MLNAFSNNKAVEIRSPHAIRPWQHVLEPLSGYITIAEHLYEQGPAFAEAWNFGPREEDAQPVEWIVEKLVSEWGDKASWFLSEGEHPHEAHYLKLDCSKAKMRLNWTPVWSLEETLGRIVVWQKAWLDGQDIKQHTVNEIKEYIAARAGK